MRIDPDGLLAQTAHPASLGSTLTHPSITTDYSESLLELITPVLDSPESLINYLCDLHTFVYQNIGDEKLWVNSMPCILQGDENIPLGQYGSSNIGQMKTVYRRGLGHRYGRLMQAIAGIHYNFSLSRGFWQSWHDHLGKQGELQDTISEYYFGAVRNVHRYAWLVFYLFGASPAVCKTFLAGREHALDSFDRGSFYKPFATTLRMSSLGYSSDAQSSIDVSFDNVEDYSRTLRAATETSYPAYENIGLKDGEKYLQLNTNVIQIENEYYAVVRPKRTIRSGEKPSCALQSRGVEYLELRSFDLNPFEPVGISETDIAYLDLFLMYCTFSESQPISNHEKNEIAENKKRTAEAGLDQSLNLLSEGEEIRLQDWANTMLDQQSEFAELLDQVKGGDRYKNALSVQKDKLSGQAQTPARQILQKMTDNDWTFYEFAMNQAEEHETFFKNRTLSKQTRQNLTETASTSIEKQLQIEKDDILSFDDFLADYFYQH